MYSMIETVVVIEVKRDPTNILTGTAYG